jgi:hypothetical protein
LKPGAGRGIFRLKPACFALSFFIPAKAEGRFAQGFQQPGILRWRNTVKMPKITAISTVHLEPSFGIQRNSFN